MLDANGGNYAALPVSIRSAISGKHINELQKYAEYRAKGVEASTDWNTYYELRKDAQLLKATNLLSYKHQLSDTEFKELVKEQDNLRSGKAESLTATQTASGVLNQFLREAGINPNPSAEKGENSGAARVGRAMRAQQEAITVAEIAKGKKLSPDEIEKVTAKLFTNVEVKGSWWNWNDTEKPRFDLRASDEIVVPTAERAQIVAALTEKKRPVNEATILDMYTLKNNLTR
jgi:soluble lytic murein transglycosylase